MRETVSEHTTLLVITDMRFGGVVVAYDSHCSVFNRIYLRKYIPHFFSILSRMCLFGVEFVVVLIVKSGICSGHSQCFKWCQHAFWRNYLSDEIQEIWHFFSLTIPLLYPAVLTVSSLYVIILEECGPAVGVCMVE